MIDSTITQPAIHVSKRVARPRISLSVVFGLIVIVIGAAAMLIPFLWMLSASLMSLSEVIKVPPVFFDPSKYSLANYLEVWTVTGFNRFFVNSTFVAFTITF